MQAAARIDYVSLRVPFDLLDKTEFLKVASERAAFICAEGGYNPRSYRHRSYYDQGLKKHLSVFDIWGEAANDFFFAFAPHYWADISRLDYREGVEAERLNWDEFFRVVKARNKGKNRVDLIDSPLREKDGKRATGGTGLILGAPDSARRLSFYQRAKEGPAYEYQFSGGELRKWLNPILRDGAPEGTLMERHVFQLLQGEAHRQCMRRTGLTLEDLEAGVSVAAAKIDYTDSEQVLQQLDLLWEVLPADAQEAFLEAHTSASPEEIADAVERVRLTAPEAWEEEPAGLWEDRF